ncbi:YciI family protein [Chitinophaga alhagiae]|uniref:YciI family protein n=1 Tax=Chitinophaga alhagiae TaxID=2203219 RepID=UPI000E5C1B4F|nr:YciI family protein [Chitinophaga alhagiae]
MKEFMLIFRLSEKPVAPPSPEQMQERMNWLAGIAAQNKLVDKGNRLSPAGARTVKPGNVVSDGPFTEIKEFVTGYMVLKAASIEDATEIARANPILKMGGSVEIRAVLTPEEK